MAEEADIPEAGDSNTGVDPTATAMALAGASRERADSFLKQQEALIADQRHHLHEQLKQLRLNIWEKYLGVLLRVATAIMGVGVAGVVGYMVWEAANSNGLLIEPLSVPPELAARGLTGEVVAAKLLDQLSQMQAQTNSARAAKSYTNDWGQSGLKLDIPETGISFTELDDFFRAKLGHDTRITGEIVLTNAGLDMTARAGGEGTESVTGSPGDLNGLVKKTAESIYQLTQPFRYGMYLASHDRVAEALADFKTVSQTGSSRQDRAWGYAYWALLAGEEIGIDAEYQLLQQALKAEPDNVQAHLVMGLVYQTESLPQQATEDWKATSALLSNDKLGMYSAQAAAGTRPNFQAQIDVNSGDFRAALETPLAYGQSGLAAAPFLSALLAGVEASAHDLADARAVIAGLANYAPDFQHGDTLLYGLRARMLIDSQAQNWLAVLSDADAIALMVQKYPGLQSSLPTMTVPWTAYAEARLGRTAQALTDITPTPMNCYDCLIARGRIAELQGWHAEAHGWFVRAINGQKSIPFAHTEWGQVLLARGQPDAAIAKFRLANQKGPHFADPLEGWGEALIAKNRSDLALAKFAEASKYAPNWGRLHLKWGEALYYAGKKVEAKAQFTQAAQLDLTSTERSELKQHLRLSAA